MSNLVIRAVTPISMLVKRVMGLDFTVVKRHIDMLEMVKSTQGETEQLMGYLQHRPEEWVVLDEKHPWYFAATNSTDTLLRHSLDNATYLIHLRSRWMMIGNYGATGLEVVPAIFLFTEHARDGLAVSFYRVLGGGSLAPSWIEKMKELVQYVITSHQEAVLPVERSTPYDEMYKVNYG